MIPPQQLNRYLKARPFHPIRLHMASGKTFDIRHPEMADVGKNTVSVFTALVSKKLPNVISSTVSLLLMESVSLVDDSE